MGVRVNKSRINGFASRVNHIAGIVYFFQAIGTAYGYNFSAFCYKSVGNGKVGINCIYYAIPYYQIGVVFFMMTGRYDGNQ